MMLGTMMPASADVGLKPDNKVNHPIGMRGTVQIQFTLPKCMPF
jgi:hypothetical protein